MTKEYTDEEMERMMQANFREANRVSSSLGSFFMYHEIGAKDAMAGMCIALGKIMYMLTLKGIPVYEEDILDWIHIGEIAADEMVEQNPDLLMELLRGRKQDGTEQDKTKE